MAENRQKSATLVIATEICQNPANFEFDCTFIEFCDFSDRELELS